MLQLCISLQLASLGQPFKKAINTASRMGVDAIEIDARRDLPYREMSRTAIRHVRKLLDDLNLRVSALSFPTRRGYNVLSDLDQRVEATKRVMSLAYDLGTDLVTNQIGEIAEDEESSEWALLTETLTTIGKHGQLCGATLLARTGTEPGSELQRLIKALPVGSLGVDFDPAELVVNKLSPQETMEEVASEVRIFRARDAVRDLAQRRGLEVQLGRGIIDFAELLGTLENAGYRGPLTLERRYSDNVMVELHEGVQYLRNLFS